MTHNVWGEVAPGPYYPPKVRSWTEEYPEVPEDIEVGME